MKLSDILTRIIKLAQVVTIERNARADQLPAGFVSLADLPKYEPSAAEEELKTFLRQQTVAVIFTVLTIMYVGRDRDNVKKFSEHYYRLRDTFTKPEYAIEKLMTKTHVVTYLVDGLRRLDKAGINIDTLETAS